eukprot:CAMPEP_0206057154 /NCGR_PEP_ID=MMETSP1466-20131121/43765_1 /ASSEMBLY_ACC=CAM_ASM_001126 /TAXON_ID=44452 /ORGANISM="Pavlova gyrans, Strain CCMP608" /LENGTH=110 /DNA_ID=CAMNT_0053432421 /DNA_START=206 /DNA_END=535 /DNA_ORIENTATION=+
MRPALLRFGVLGRRPALGVGAARLLRPRLAAADGQPAKAAAVICGRKPARGVSDDARTAEPAEAAPARAARAAGPRGVRPLRPRGESGGESGGQAVEPRRHVCGAGAARP